MDNLTGELVKKLRVNIGISQSDLAVKTGLSRRMVCAIELGESNITAAQLKVLSRFFNVTTDYLLFGCDDAPTPVERDILNEIREDSAVYNALIHRVTAKKTIKQLCVTV